MKLYRKIFKERNLYENDRGLQSMLIKFNLLKLVIKSDKLKFVNGEVCSPQYIFEMGKLKQVYSMHSEDGTFFSMNSMDLSKWNMLEDYYDNGNIFLQKVRSLYNNYVL